MDHRNAAHHERMMAGKNENNNNKNNTSHTVDLGNFDLLKVLGTGAYGKVYLVRKRDGPDKGKLYAMKVLKKASVVQKPKTLEHTMTERRVLESVRKTPFVVSLHYAFQTETKLHLVMGEYPPCPSISLFMCLSFVCASPHILVRATLSNIQIIKLF